MLMFSMLQSLRSLAITVTRVIVHVNVSDLLSCYVPFMTFLTRPLTSEHNM